MGKVTVCTWHQLEQPPAGLRGIAGLCSALLLCLVIIVLGGVNTLNRQVSPAHWVNFNLNLIQELPELSH